MPLVPHVPLKKKTASKNDLRHPVANPFASGLAYDNLISSGELPSAEARGCSMGSSLTTSVFAAITLLLPVTDDISDPLLAAIAATMPLLILMGVSRFVKLRYADANAW